MRELFVARTETVAGQERARSGVDAATEGARSHELECAALRVAHGVPDAFHFRAGRAVEHEGPGDVALVSMQARPDVHQEDIAARESELARIAVRLRGGRADQT